MGDVSFGHRTWTSEPRPGALAAYRAVLASRIRAQRSYRTSFAVDMVGAMTVSIVELIELAVIFGSVGTLGGLDVRAGLLVFGIAETSFALADLVVGHLDRLPRYLRAGTWDVFCIRPQPLLLQLITSDISLKRLARVGVGVACIVGALIVNDIDWTAGRAGMLALALTFAPLLYAALFVSAAGVQFVLVNGAEFTNAFTYGGRYAGTQPASVWPRSLAAVFGFLVPVAFTAYLPALVILGLPGGGFLPAWLAWFLPLAAAWCWLVAMTLWHFGVRHYQGGGG